ncbi:sensor histidine kinase [Nocardioides panaciterrulae]|uniref:Anti-sigma regulatory factor (Ser/Thr protein kinase) n=1 Tax=Nocardioides panaciterrulae TaxID=661492 RepID=A0A7Y9J9H5_9ACTN|nr:sensor histidine kinase [Nocardioides panaciterrulae]NYD40600.1 anti-sigma regulatory factor (Ser/Thr protein kinase) [Nocardioides panaciterrulae]
MTTHPDYRHSVMVHDTDEELVSVTEAFVARGLASGAEVLVHSSSDRVELVRGVIGAHPGLEYALDEDLYDAPARTLFDYQRVLAERAGTRPLWVTGTVPLGRDAAEQASWHRYESAVDQALGAFAFAALCTYDTRTRPPWVIAAARATHRTVNVDLTDRHNQRYVEPTTFLSSPLAGRPEAPTTPPSAATVVLDLSQLSVARELVQDGAVRHSALSRGAIEGLRVAVNEVATNGLVHGRPPVRLTLWAEVGRLTCLVEDSGPGLLDAMTGYRRPEGSRSLGMWAARQLVDDLQIGRSSSGGCSVLLTITEAL